MVKIEPYKQRPNTGHNIEYLSLVGYCLCQMLVGYNKRLDWVK